ncbi:adenosylmethionine--8-amino-7-oxononanoate transaminase [Candidatus Tachikawaea gelatinosa]|uniref:Adenosylmethionine-8-amino-7-oxononanoate aminotransferase n=1 Tax=Candidatus Tachikawaea gelatinosa TaxID=1410383 RepID=A0A090AS00_9ENTR|nr:adenosylmethionine--8-amino-7-oxononanoate transaminase [Candidatus Tachikawaea gelatinosa]BAP58620.1 adenosylmethionine-8-amino-7-oxononanoate aminotransferase [Candidatus Tachikawaea gelatinosa]
MFTNKDYNFDRNHIWHPYTSIKKPLPCYPVKKAYGCKLELFNGKLLIDGMSSWWTAIHGYNHPRLNNALKKQINNMSHVMFGGITHIPAIHLCKKILSIMPKPLSCIFLADSGSIAIEVSMKMAFQYWMGKKRNKTRLLTIKNGYHGDTFGAMSISDLNNSIHSFWNKYFPCHIFAESPKSAFHKKWKNSDIDDFFRLVKNNHSEIAAVILEPIFQGIGRMYFYHPNFLKKVREICNDYDLLLIFDEIATGFGRSGKMFAYQHADNVIPDIICIGKALTGGNLTLAAVVCKKEISDGIDASIPKSFMHGPTFMGNPLACAVSLESINLLIETNWEKKVKHIENILQKGLIPLLKYPQVKDIRVLGAIGIVECKKIINIAKIQKFFVEKGVWIRPFFKFIYLVPPYIITTQELLILIETIEKAVERRDFFAI